VSRVLRASLFLLLATLAVVPAQAASSVAFSAPVKVTPAGGGGYEPAVYAGPFGDIFVTAHKENAEDALAPDSGSQSGTRSSSWAWASVDGGKTFTDIPGLPLNAENRQVGDEGDLALDNANHLYFVDTNVVDDNLTRWTVAGPGLAGIHIDYTRPLIPTAQPVDDRPWITAHGSSGVFYFGNEGDKTTYPLGSGQKGSGPGRYTEYASYDGGSSFNFTGYTLPDSGWCRPAADKLPGSPYVYAFCTNDGGSNDTTDNCPCDPGTLWAYVSSDNGHTFTRHKAGTYEALDSTTSWPTLAIGPRGDIWALYVDGILDKSGNTVANRLLLFHSTNHGSTWSRQDITPVPGRYRYSWLSISPDGRFLGVGLYYRPNNSSPWHVYGAIWRPGARPSLVSLDPTHPVAPANREAPGDLLGSSFNADDTLDVVWTRDVVVTPAATLFRDIYFARSLP
jgi:hypothetical protein